VGQDASRLLGRRVRCVATDAVPRLVCGVDRVRDDVDYFRLVTTDYRRKGERDD
jgi:hypothetical protein